MNKVQYTKAIEMLNVPIYESHIYIIIIDRIGFSANESK